MSVIMCVSSVGGEIVEDGGECTELLLLADLGCCTSEWSGQRLAAHSDREASMAYWQGMQSPVIGKASRRSNGIGAAQCWHFP
jgi:hypothetical protein